MAVDTTAPRSRRVLLGAALGAVAATAAQALGRPLAARAEGETIVVGGEYATATSRTRLANVTNNTDVFRAETSGTGAAVSARSTNGIAVDADSTNDVAVRGISAVDAGVVGVSSSYHGVHGSSTTSYGVRGTSTSGTGVLGETWATSGPTRGVTGISISPDGIGVEGQSQASSGGTVGVEGRAFSPDGYAVRGVNEASSGGAGVAGFTQSTFGESSAVLGQVTSPQGYGVLGDTLATSTSARAIVGHAPAGTGVLGWAGSGSTPGGKTRTGVYGRATGSTAARGVYGYSSSGVGVYAEAATGSALKVVGKATFSRSGKLTIPANATSVTKTGVALTSTSLVLAVLQTSRAGVYVRAAVPNVAGSSFTVYLNKVASTTAGTTVAWFVVN